MRSKIVFISVILLFFSVNSTVSYAKLTKYDFLEYVGKKVGITQAYSEYKVCNPTNAEFRILSKADNYFNWYFNEVKGNLKENWFEIKVNETYKKIIGVVTCDDPTVLTCNCTTDYKYVDSWHWKWVKWSPIGFTFKPKECYNIRIYGTYEPAFKENSIAIDNVINMAGYSFNEYDWWNISYVKYWNATFTNTTYIDDNYPIKFTLNDTTDGGFGIYYHIAVVNSSNNEISFAFEENGDGILSDGENLTWRWNNDEPYSVYYNCSGCGIIDAKNLTFEDVFWTFNEDWNTIGWADKWESSDQSKYTTQNGVLISIALADSTQYIETQSNLYTGKYWKVIFSNKLYGITDTAYTLLTTEKDGAWNNKQNVFMYSRATTKWSYQYNTTTGSSSATIEISVADTTSYWTWELTHNETDTLYIQLYDDGVETDGNKYSNYGYPESSGLYYRHFAWSSDNFNQTYIRARPYSSPEPNGFFTGIQMLPIAPAPYPINFILKPNYADNYYCIINTTYDINCDYYNPISIDGGAMLISNHNWCLDNQTIARNITYQITINSNVTNITTFQTEICRFGCDNRTNFCNPSPIEQYGQFFMFIAIILIIIGIISWLWLKITRR